MISFGWMEGRNENKWMNEGTNEGMTHNNKMNAFMKLCIFTRAHGGIMFMKELCSCRFSVLQQNP